MKRFIVILLALSLLLAGCGDTGDALFNTQVDKQQVVSNRIPKDNQTVCLATDALKNFLDNYRLGVGLTVAGQGDVKLHNNVEFSWDCEEDNNGYTLIYTTSPEFSDAVSVETEESTVSVPGLFVGTTYYWQVVTHLPEGDKYSEVFTFRTEDTVRAVEIPGVSNVRDIGGYMTESGTHRVAQGMIYRGATLGHITTEGKWAFREIYQIKTDLDLRWPTDPGYPWGGCSPVGEDINYLNVPGVIYNEDHSVGESIADELAVFTDAANYPIYIHCSAGRDRTGTLAFVLGALLGVPEEDLCIDYELTSMSAKSYDKGDASGFNKFYNFLEKFKQYEGETLQEKAESYCLEWGVTREQIDQIRSIMLKEIQ